MNNVVYISKNGLYQVEYRFFIDVSFSENINIVFHFYGLSKRKTKRHKFKLYKKWSKYENRRHNRTKPQLPQRVKNDILEQVCKSIRVIDEK